MTLTYGVQRDDYKNRKITEKKGLDCALNMGEMKSSTKKKLDSAD